MTGPLLQALTSGPGVQVFTGKLIAVATDGTVSVGYGGGVIPGVARLASYSSPQVGDVVHVLQATAIGMVVLGAEFPRTSPPLPEVGDPVLILPRYSGTRSHVTGEWSIPEVAQSPDTDGAYFYDPQAFRELTGLALAGFELALVTAAHLGVLSLVLINNPSPAGAFSAVSPIHIAATPTQVLTWVRLPLSWVAALIAGSATGIGMSSDTDSVTIVQGGTLRITPLTPLL